ncbi:MAG: thiamine phosphate synthase [Myxococcales bacterium]|nr:thiamine phosphate synthase [Myxococcales bacterium]
MRGLYAIIDPDLSGEHEPVALAEAILRGGCAALQLRSKTLPDDAYLALARPLLTACDRVGVPFFVNDRVDVAEVLQGEGRDVGLHLGQDDMPVLQARKRFRGPVGLSTHNLDQVRQAHRLQVDLIGFGPVFPTRSKARPDPLVGPEGLRQACAASAVPVVAIGGVQRDNLSEVLAAGASLFAMIGALSSAADPEGLARCLHGRVGVP